MRVHGFSIEIILKFYMILVRKHIQTLIVLSQMACKYSFIIFLEEEILEKDTYIEKSFFYFGRFLKILDRNQILFIDSNSLNITFIYEF